MEKNQELLKHIYETSEMGNYTCKVLLDDLKDKDNKIKKILTEIQNNYQKYQEKASSKLKSEKPEKGMMSKMMASMGIKKEVKNDNSDASMAEMLIQGLMMGNVEIEKKIKAYDGIASDDEIDFAKEFLKFQEKNIEKLKKYL